MANKILKSIKFPGLEGTYIIPANGGEGGVSNWEDLQNKPSIEAGQGENSIVIGTGEASGAYSIAEGQESESRGLASHTEGYKTLAVGDYSHAEGQGNYTIYNDAVIGANAHRIVIPGVDPHIFENTNKYLVLTFNDGSTMSYIGFYESETGEIGLLDLNNERAEVPAKFINTTFKVTKYDNVAVGKASHVEGINNIALGEAQHVQGKYNIAYDNSFAHIIGNGTSDEKRSNAYTLDWDGNAWFAGAINCKDKATTLANLGAAPSGYGLGKIVVKNWSEVDAIRASGWYTFYSGVVIDEQNFGTCVMRVDVLDGNLLVQTVHPNSGTMLEIKRMCIGGAWQPWEWVNPPMELWKEYRTTKRWQGKPVYTQAINMSSFPVNSYKTSGFGANATSIMNLHGELYYNGEWIPFPVHLNGELVAYCWTDGSNVGVTTLGDISSGNANFVIEYTKN